MTVTVMASQSELSRGLNVSRFVFNVVVISGLELNPVHIKGLAPAFHQFSGSVSQALRNDFGQTLHE